MHPCTSSLIPWPLESNLVFPENISEMLMIKLQLAHLLFASFSTISVAERINMNNAQLTQLFNHYINVQ